MCAFAKRFHTAPCLDLGECWKTDFFSSPQPQQLCYCDEYCAQHRADLGFREDRDKKNGDSHTSTQAGRETLTLTLWIQILSLKPANDWQGKLTEMEQDISNRLQLLNNGHPTQTHHLCVFAVWFHFSLVLNRSFKRGFEDLCLIKYCSWAIEQVCIE